MHTKTFVRNRTVALLRRARELIADPRHWTQDTIAKRRGGERCMPVGNRATQWCAIGAIEHEANPNLPGVAAFARMELANAISPNDCRSNARVISRFNDRHSHKDVLAVFDRAIRRVNGVSAQPG